MSTPPTAPPRPPGTKPGPIDPRFRERLIEVRRVEGRRRLRVLLILAGFLAVALLGWGFTRSPLLDVDHVHVTGTVHTAPADIATASGVHTGMAMFDVDIGDAAARVRAVPWILRVHVERQWPSTVSITVVERAPVAAVPAKAGVAVVDRTGRVLAIGPTALASTNTYYVGRTSPGNDLLFSIQQDNQGNTSFVPDHITAQATCARTARRRSRSLRTRSRTPLSSPPQLSRSTPRTQTRAR